MLTQERLKEVLVYDKDTGNFYRKSPITRWNTTPAGSKTKGRIYIFIDGKLYLAHRLAFLYMIGEFPKNQVDHINGNQEDNRWSNLRDVTQLQNLENKHRARENSSTGVLGVQVNNKCNSYMARITSNGITYYLGSFPTIEEASKVYLEAKQKLHKGYIHEAKSNR